MKRKLSLLPLLVLLALVGCGSSTKTASTPAPPRSPAPVVANACSHVPAVMGCAVKVAFSHNRGAGVLAPTENTSRFGCQGIDISNYQSFPDLGVATRNGLCFLIGQSNDGSNFADFNFVGNWVRARQLGLSHGAYVFARPGCASCQAALLASQVRRAGGMDSNALPPTIDAEVPGAYCNVGPIAYWLRIDLHISHVLTYTSPGLWECGLDVGGTLLYVAVWGQPGYSFAGWHGYVAQQFCGLHCYFPGVSGEVDRDVDHGLLSLIVPPESSSQRRARERRELAGHEGYLRYLRARIIVLRHVQSRYGCTYRRARHQHLTHTCKRWFFEGDADHLHGRYEDRKIAELKKALR